jgi:hypothetical protein
MSASGTPSKKNQPYFTRKGVDKICLNALKQVDLLPDTPRPIRIDAFVERYFKIHPAYEALPPGVLGFTEFSATGVSAMVISSRLDDEGTKIAERRIRTTFAHEAGHGLLHTELFNLGAKPVHLFEDDDPQPHILCRDDGETGQTGYRGKWWELQANLAIGGLLMPVALTLDAAKPFTKEEGLLGLPVLKDKHAAARALAEIFDVNPVVARIRLDELFEDTHKDAQQSF